MLFPPCGIPRPVLVLDSFSAARQRTERVLRAAGFAVWGVSHPLALHEAIAQTLATGGPPAALLLDVVLPGANAYALCSELRQATALATVPVFMLSTTADLQARRRALACGATDLLAKSLSPQLLLERLAQQLPARCALPPASRAPTSALA